jgi:hypothetical protein
MGLETQNTTSPQFGTNSIHAKYGYLSKTHFTLLASHVKNWSCKVGKWAAFTYVETIACSCKGMKKNIYCEKCRG